MVKTRQNLTDSKKPAHGLKKRRRRKPDRDLKHIYIPVHSCIEIGAFLSIPVFPCTRTESFLKLSLNVTRGCLYRRMICANNIINHKISLNSYLKCSSIEVYFTKSTWCTHGSNCTTHFDSTSTVFWLASVR